MTHDEMRRRLAEAMGWADMEEQSSGMITGQPPGQVDPDAFEEIPDPLEDDRDAALLRAWCLEQGWTVKSEHTPVALTIVNRAWPAVMVRVSRAPVVVSALVRHADEPDPCRRERLALCRAVLQAIEAGGEA
jgi:hypothetical protein